MLGIIYAPAHCVCHIADETMSLRWFDSSSATLQGAISQVGALSYWGNVVTYAIRTGFCGALSTVSTFVAEVTSHWRMKPHRQHGEVDPMTRQETKGLGSILVNVGCLGRSRLTACGPYYAGAGATEDGAREAAGVHVFLGLFVDGSSAGRYCVWAHVLDKLSLCRSSACKAACMVMTTQLCKSPANLLSCVC